MCLLILQISFFAGFNNLAVGRFMIKVLLMVFHWDKTVTCAVNFDSVDDVCFSCVFDSFFVYIRCCVFISFLIF